MEDLAFLAALCVGREKRGESAEHGEECSRAFGASAHARKIFAEEEDVRGFAGFISVFPDPGAIAIGPAESGFHSGADR